MSDPHSTDPIHPRESIYYPEVFPLTLTHDEFPTSETVHDSMSMPYGLLATPFIPSDDGASLLQHNPKLQSYRHGGVARCDNCGGYINPFCDSTALRWVCALCDTRNTFARSMLRYRQVDLKLLPEMQHLLLDYPLPLSTGEDGGVKGARSTGSLSSRSNPSTKNKKTKAQRKLERIRSKYHCPASERPLVHVFLIQESMPLDCIQAVIDAISMATSADPVTGLHPDIEIILLTFSNRIGIYRLHKDTDTSSATGDMSSDSSTYLLPACIQYSHFSLEQKLKQCGENKGSSDDQDNEGGVFDGQNNAEFLSLAAGGRNSKPAHVEKVCPLLSLNEIASFDDVRVPIGQVRQSLRASLSALYDASPSVSSAGGSSTSGYDSFGQGNDSSQSENLHGPLVMIGPVLEEVISWIVDIDSTLASTQDPTVAPTAESQSGGGSSLGGLMGLLAGFGLTSAQPDPSEANDDWIIGDNIAELKKKRTSSPIDRCTGVQLHLLVSSPQDLVVGAHDSVSSAEIKTSEIPRLDSSWISNMGERCAQHGLGVHVWGIAAFEDSYSGLQDLLPLAQKTGGQLNRIVLGSDPSTERIRFGLNLSRSLAVQSANKCLLKLRSSKLVDTSLGGSGHMTPDDELPGIYRIATCSTSATVGFTLKYNPTPSNGEDDEVAKYQRSHNQGPGFLVMQIAMSYSTLAEVVSDDEENDVTEEERKNLRRRRKLRKNRMKAKQLQSGEVLTDSDGSSGSCDDQDDQDDQDDELLGDEKSDITKSKLLNDNDNAEIVYLNQVSVNLDILHEQKAVQAEKKLRDDALVQKLGKEIVHSKFRRQFSTRSPMKYLHNKKLCAVRRLRVITVMVECTPKIPRLIKSANSTIMAVLIVRRAIALLQCNKVDESLEYLYNWCVEMTVSLCRIIWKHKQLQHKNAVVNNEPEDWNGGGKSYTGIEYPSTPPEDRVDFVISEGLSYGKIWSFLQVMYGAVHVIMIQKHYLEHMMVSGKSSELSNGDTGKKMSQTSNPLLFTKSWGDSFAEISSLIMTADFYLAEKLLYPELIAITTATMCAERRKLRLRREDLITSGQSSYLIDSGRDLVLYRTISKASSKNSSFGGTLNKSTSNASTDSPPPPLPPSVIPPTTGVVSAAVTAATSLLYPPPPPPTNIDTTVTSDMIESADNIGPVDDSNDEESSLVTDPSWLVNDINRRLYITPVAPRVHVAEAGKMSSSFFTEKLLDDMSNVDGGYSGFIKDISSRVRLALLQQP